MIRSIGKNRIYNMVDKYWMYCAVVNKCSDVVRNSLTSSYVHLFQVPDLFTDLGGQPLCGDGVDDGRHEESVDQHLSLTREQDKLVQQGADWVEKLAGGVQPKDGEDEEALAGGEDAVADDEHLEGARVGGLGEEEAADGEGDGGEHGRGHGEQEEGVPEDLHSW